MLKLFGTYLLLFTVLVTLSCKQTRYVPEGKYLLAKNEILITGGKLSKSEINSIIRQKPNFKSMGIKWELMAYNSVDSTKVAEKRKRLNVELRETNRERLKREDRINSKRIERAQRKGKPYYAHKSVSLRDTVEPRMFFREWYKYRIGSPPVIFDSISYDKTLSQLNNYIRNKGYYYGRVEGKIDYWNNRKCQVTYHLQTGPRYYIDSVYYLTSNYELDLAYQDFLATRHDPPLVGKPFDIDMLDAYRNQVARFLRDSSFYGFNASHIKFLVDTTYGPMKVKLGVELSGKIIIVKEHKDSLIVTDHCKNYMDEIVYHVADSVLYEGSLSDTLRMMGLSLYDGQFLRTLDTMYVPVNSGKGLHDAVMLYNGELFVKPWVLEMYNELEKDGLYSEKSVENTYNGLLRLGLFTVIKVEMEELNETNRLVAHYYLVPSKKQSFGFEPRATNSNGFLGVSASVNYTNRNLFKGAEKLTLSISGGFESQPAVFDETVDGVKIKTASRSFNTFEIGPSAKLEIPGFFPFRFTKFGARSKPQTIISTAYNFQKRDDFERGIFQMNYSWKFINTKTRIYHIGLPGASVVKLVNIDKSDVFSSKLEALNDLFLLSAYSNQFIWQDWRFSFEYNIKNKTIRKKNFQLYINSTFDPAGNILSLFKNSQDTIANGNHAVFGVQYAQFARLDNEFIYSQPFSKERSVNLKLLIGGGLPYGNSKTTLPYDYSFFGGGANDNRGWRARSLGPGSYKYYLDTNRTATQIGDIRLGTSAELRFPINTYLKGAFFVDAGNVWSVFEDINRPGGKFSSNWYKEIAIATGIGIRVDLEYFVLRFDLGLPIRNPALPDMARWIFQSREAYYQEAEAFFGAGYEALIPRPFIPQLHFGIGYPF